MKIEVEVKVYVGMNGDGYGHNSILGVFSSEEAARAKGADWVEEFLVEDGEKNV